MATVAEAASGASPEPSGRQSVLRQLFGDAADLVKTFGLYFAAITASLTSLFVLWDQFELWQTWGWWGMAGFAGVVAAPLVIALLTETLPRWRAGKRKERLRREGIKGETIRPGYFRLQPYDDRDHDDFGRPDGAHLAAVEWITRAKAPLLYLTGRSGTGKSSLLAAWVLPELQRAQPAFQALVVRSFADPIAALRKALTENATIFRRKPAEDDPRKLLEKACAATKPKRLLIVLDQFEEFVILQKPTSRAAMEALIASLVEHPIPDLLLLVVLRSDYIKELGKLTIPPLRADENWFEIGPFSRGSARDFIAGSGLVVSDEMMEAVLDEAGQIEDNPGLIRPITANMMGVVLERFRGGLPKGTAPGLLIRNYLKDAISVPDIADHAPRILDQMISHAGTKSPKSETQLSKTLKSDEALVRGCLVQLGRQGLVREMDPAGRVWEVSHDFVARLLGQIVARIRRPWLRRAQPVLGPASLAIWLLLLFGAYPAWQIWQLNRAQQFLAQENVLVTQHEDGSHSLEYGRGKAGAFERTLPYLDPLMPIVSLMVAGDGSSTSLPALDALTSLQSLTISSNAQLASLPALDALTSLQSLAISDNAQLASLPALDALTSLQSLTISGNAQLASLPALDALTSLQSLDISYNAQLASLPALDALTSLQSLNISSNAQLASLPALDALKSLRKVGIEGRQELLESAIAALKGAPGLEHLVLLPEREQLGIGERLNAERQKVGLKEVAVRHVHWLAWQNLLRP
jgi:NACHT domain/Leucine Rich repeats (2 copies)